MLRPYQQDAFSNARSAAAKYDRILVQGATGSGKTVVVSAITSSAAKRGYRVWFIVPRTELLNQAAKHFVKWDIAHSQIAAGKNESRVFKIHIVSKDTLIRRWDKIKNWPNLIMIDEAHINYKFQIDLIKRAPPRTKIIGFSATPERLDGLGLSDIYQSLIPGPSIPWLTEHDYLSPLRYFAPPVEGIENLHKRGTDVDADELDELLEKNKIYGKVIGHYEKWGSVKKQTISTTSGMTHSNNNYNRGKPALFFLRSVKAAYDMADKFQAKGYKFFCVEGKMKGSERKRLIDGLTNGQIDGLTSCDILTYGFDCPRVEYGASLRPTMSRALYFQMVGRILRPFEDKKTGYKKEEALFFDHVNLINEHYDPEHPGVPMFYLDNIEWNFEGKKKRKKLEKPDISRSCPYIDFMYCHRQRCEGCKHHPDGQIDFQMQQEEKIIDIQLLEAQKPKPMNERPAEERREFIDNINQQIAEYTKAAEEGRILPGPVGKLLKIAKSLNRSIMWVYYTLSEKTCTPEEKQSKSKAVNIPLLHEIARQMDLKPGWVWYKTKFLEGQRDSA